jgi:hypothetical protein
MELMCLEPKARGPIASAPANVVAFADGDNSATPLPERLRGFDRIVLRNAAPIASAQKTVRGISSTGIERLARSQFHAEVERSLYLREILLFPWLEAGF